jgi:hypothetical protein
MGGDASKSGNIFVRTEKAYYFSGEMVTGTLTSNYYSKVLYIFRSWNLVSLETKFFSKLKVRKFVSGRKISLSQSLTDKVELGRGQRLNTTMERIHSLAIRYSFMDSKDSIPNLSLINLGI